MPRSKDVAGVRAVRALTRFHFGGTKRRTLTREAAQDRRLSASWGWHENIVGIGVSWKREYGRRMAEAMCVTFYVLRKEPKRRLLRRERIPECLEFGSVDARIVTDVVQVPGRFVAHGPTVRPIRPGAEVGHMRGGRGTLGPIVQQEGSTTPLALSCSHVIARSGAVLDFGKKIEQPVNDDASSVVGTLVDFTKLRSGTLVAFDVAFAALDVPVRSWRARHDHRSKDRQQPGGQSLQGRHEDGALRANVARSARRGGGVSVHVGHR